jgi:hypothetical protein
MHRRHDVTENVKYEVLETGNIVADFISRRIPRLRRRPTPRLPADLSTDVVSDAATNNVAHIVADSISDVFPSYGAVPTCSPTASPTYAKTDTHDHVSADGNKFVGARDCHECTHRSADGSSPHHDCEAPTNTPTHTANIPTPP